jgi:hypothetical protein
MTEILENDQLSMNRINPYTATNTFGVSYNGGYKSTEDLPWMLPREEPPEEPEEDHIEDHFDPKAIFRSPAMNNMTGGVNPALSFMYPARKIQRDDGTTTWSREIVWKDSANYVDIVNQRSEYFPIILFIFLLIIVLGLQKYLKL